MTRSRFTFEVRLHFVCPALSLKDAKKWLSDEIDKLGVCWEVNDHALLSEVPVKELIEEDNE